MNELEQVGPHRKRCVWFLVISLTICGFLAAFFLFNPLNPGFARNGPPPVPSDSSAVDVTCLGRILPGGRILRVAAPSGAVVRELSVRRGQWVEQGEILASLRDYARELALLDRSEKELAVARTELDRVRAGEKTGTIDAQKSAVARDEAILRREEADYRRYVDLHRKQVASTKQLEDVQTRRDTARESLRRENHQLTSLKDVRKEDIAIAAAKVDAAESSRKVARENVELNLIRAPASGRILEIHSYPGEAVWEKGLLEMGRGREMLVEAEVHVSDIGRVRIGAPAFISGDSIPGRLEGEVSEIVSMVARSNVLPTDPLAFSDQRVVSVWIRLEDSGPVANLGNHQVTVEIKP